VGSVVVAVPANMRGTIGRCAGLSRSLLRRRDVPRWVAQAPGAVRIPVGRCAPGLGLIEEDLTDTILQHDIVTKHRASTRILGAHEGRVACITATILRTDVHDRCVGVFGFGLERGDESVLGVHHQMVHLPLVLEPDGEIHRLLLPTN
jgi:hypothetical protein